MGGLPLTDHVPLILPVIPDALLHGQESGDLRRSADWKHRKGR